MMERRSFQGSIAEPLLQMPMSRLSRVHGRIEQYQRVGFRADSPVLASLVEPVENRRAQSDVATGGASRRDDSPGIDMQLRGVSAHPAQRGFRVRNRLEWSGTTAAKYTIVN